LIYGSDSIEHDVKSFSSSRGKGFGKKCRDVTLSILSTDLSSRLWSQTIGDSSNARGNSPYSHSEGLPPGKMEAILDVIKTILMRDEVAAKLTFDKIPSK
jgi:hypothetical protein